MSEPLGLVDTHAHLMDEVFAADLPQVLDRAREAGVTAIMCVGYDLKTSRAAVDLAQRLPGMRATVGIHPNSSAQHQQAAYDEIEQLSLLPVVVGIGETGLDHYRDWSPPARQRESLEWHLDLAERQHLPVVIHNREADEDVGPMLEASAARRPAGEIPGVLHCFGWEDPAFLERLLEAGYYISFAGPVTFKNAGGLRAMAARVPLDRLLVETDCPYLTPDPHRGKRNEPAFVRHTAERLADILEIPLASVAAAAGANATRVFGAVAPIAQGATT